MRYRLEIKFKTGETIDESTDDWIAARDTYEIHFARPEVFYCAIYDNNCVRRIAVDQKWIEARN